MGNQHLNTVLDRVGEHVSRGELPVVVFDLDSTLFSCNPRHLRILREFASEAGSSWPGLAGAVDDIAPHEFDWDVRGPLQQRGFNDEQLAAQILDYWKARFFLDDYIREDEPLPGAVDYVTQLHEQGAMVYYLTGRHVSDMGQGTVQSLTDHGFPFWRGRTTLHLKPAFEMTDHDFKMAALADIRSYNGPVVATFENEPENANLFVAGFDDAMHFLLATTHSGKPVQPDPSIIHIPDFQLPK